MATHDNTSVRKLALPIIACYPTAHGRGLLGALIQDYNASIQEEARKLKAQN